MIDESHLPTEQQSLVFRLYKRAEIRRQIAHRKSVQEGKSDRIAALLDEAAREIQRLNAVIEEIGKHTKGRDNFQP
jgi:hypothetical protein